MDASTVSAVAAVAVAVLALGVSVWEGVANRRHNRLSVKPALCIQYHNHLSEPLCLLLHNNGFGPAIISSLTVQVDGGDVYQIREINQLTRVLGSVGTVTSWRPDDGEVLAAGGQIPLLRYENQLQLGSADRQTETAKLESAEFRIKYKSLYEESFELVWRINLPAPA